MEKFLTYQFPVKALIAEVGRKHNTIFLAYRQDALVGYSLMREVSTPTEIGQSIKSIELARFYVDKAFKGTGVGNALMKECVAKARFKGKEVLWLGVWHENHRAIDFYTKWGFTKCGSKIFLLGDDPQLDWMMKKDLTF